MIRQQFDLHCDDGVTNKINFYQRSETPASAPIILIVPAIAVPASKYQLLAETFNDFGINAATIDLRGVGNSSVRASRQCDFSYQTIIDQELSGAVSLLQTKYPNSALYLLGHSLGGQLSVLFASTKSNSVHKNPIKGIVLAASCSVYYKGWSFPVSVGVILYTQTASLIGRILGHFPGRKLGFGGKEARSLMQDWGHNARTGQFNLKNSSHNYTKLLSTLKLPILSVNYAQDIFAPIKATKNLIKMLSSIKVRQVVLSGKDLGIEKAQHLNWLKHPKPMVKIIAESFLEHSK